MTLQVLDRSPTRGELHGYLNKLATVLLKKFDNVGQVFRRFDAQRLGAISFSDFCF